MNNENWEKELRELSYWDDKSNVVPLKSAIIFCQILRNLTLESAAKAIEEKYSGEIATDGVTKIIRDMKTK